MKLCIVISFYFVISCCFLYYGSLFALSTKKNVFNFLSHDEIIEAKDNHNKQIDLRILRIRELKAMERKAALKQFLFPKLYNILAPEALCPNLVRLGTIGDGGKWICNPFAVVQPNQACVFYSLGLNNEVSFDVEFMNLTRHKCQHIAVDKDKQNSTTLAQLKSAKVLQAKISNISLPQEHQISFKDLIVKYNITHIDLLKMDIEGYEHFITDQVFNISICQILVELHDFNPAISRKVKLNENENIYNWLHTASLAGFYLISFEVNEQATGCEFTLLNEKCFDRYGIDVVFGKYLD